MKKKIIIIFLALILVFILVYFFVFRIGKNINSENNIQNVNEPAESISNSGISNIVSDASSSVVFDSVSDQASSSQISDITNENVAPIDVEAVNKKFIEYVPKVTSKQINTFYAIAATGDMSKCEDLSDEVDSCKYYFSVYKNQDGLCGDIETNSVKLDCYKKLVFDKLSEKIKKCETETFSDIKVNCLNQIFWGNETANSCGMFMDDSVRQICADSVNLRIILEKNKNNCSEVKDASLKTFCEQHFVAGDFDKDSLSDAAELKIGTNPYFADTDGDSYSDKDEIDKGYNPCGEGLMPTPARLLEMCAAFTK